MARIGDFSFPDFNAFPLNILDDAASGLPPAPIQTTALIQSSSITVESPISAIVPATPSTAGAGIKRKAEFISSPSDPASFEEASRIAAEEDKRRRNTAASARFRVKKKQREQALEKAAKETSDKVAALEGRINQLETENKWLKNLIMEKNESKDDITALWKQFNAEAAERKASERKDGVGTKS